MVFMQDPLDHGFHCFMVYFVHENHDAMIIQGLAGIVVLR